MEKAIFESKLSRRAVEEGGNKKAAELNEETMIELGY
jgi:hypothetical protein